MFLPRVGWEVAVGFLDGLPDRPFVVGRLYNATAVVPYALPAASATTSFQSKVTPASSATQEIRMIDDAGKQEFFVHANRDHGVKVGGTMATTVGANEDHFVGLSLQSNISGGHTQTVGGKQQVDVGKELIIQVKGASSEVIAGAETINVTGNRAVLSDSSYVELIAAAYGIQCNQSNTKTTGVFARAVGGSKGLACGLGLTEAVAGARVYVCKSSRTINCSSSYGEGVTGGRRTKAGAVKEKASAKMVTSASFGKITCGGAATLKAGGKFTISAKTISIEVSSTLLAGSLEMGGKFKAKSGTTEVTGDTKRSKGAKVG
jgi:type VI secretion system secreted protein VgrG